MHATCKPISSARLGPRQNMIGPLLKSILSRVTSHQRRHTFLQRNKRDECQRQTSSAPGRRPPPVAGGALSSEMDHPPGISEGKLVQNQRVNRTRGPNFSLSQEKQPQQFLAIRKSPVLPNFPNLSDFVFLTVVFRNHLTFANSRNWSVASANQSEALSALLVGSHLSSV